MSYNTRRTTGFGTPQQSSSVGQRRPVVTNNFVSGGQLTGSQQQKPSGQSQQQPRPPQQQQQPGINFRNQNQQGQPQQNYQSQNYPTTPQQQGRYPQGQQTPTKSEPVKPVQQTPKPAPQTVAPVVPAANPPPPAPAPTPAPAPAPEQEDESMELGAEGASKKRFWNKGNKISRAEKIRRRNLKLIKILQPKNAVMILNELVRGCTYNVEELPVKLDVIQFRGTVNFEGQEFAGTGRTKNAAKNAAAETALKHLVKNKQLNNVVKKEEEGGDEKMDISEEEGGQVMPWSHIASFAMYKLFSTWGEDPNLVNRVSAQDILAASPSVAKPASPREPKPAKTMPEKAETMNPLMLIHQMLPNAVWEEVGKSGNSPNVVFTFTVTIDEKAFTGTGSSKKAAKKLAAFAACHDVLKVAYPADVWAPVY